MSIDRIIDTTHRGIQVRARQSEKLRIGQSGRVAHKPTYAQLPVFSQKEWVGDVLAIHIELRNGRYLRLHAGDGKIRLAWGGTHERKEPTHLVPEGEHLHRQGTPQFIR